MSSGCLVVRCPAYRRSKVRHWANRSTNLDTLLTDPRRHATGDLGRSARTGAILPRVDPRIAPPSFLMSPTPDPRIDKEIPDARYRESVYTIVVVRTICGEHRIVTTGSYLARDSRTAEVALPPAEAVRGHGLGMLLLEHLARLRPPSLRALPPLRSHWCAGNRWRTLW